MGSARFPNPKSTGLSARSGMANNEESIKSFIDRLSQCINHNTTKSLPPLTPNTVPKVGLNEVDKLARTVKNPDWRQALKHILTAAALQSSDGNIDALLKERVQSVKSLTRIAANAGLWAAQVLSDNCDELSQLVVRRANQSVQEEVAAVIRQAFRLTVSDFENEEPKEGRTRVCYAVAVAQLRVYVAMRAYPLAEGILHAVEQYSPHIPELSQSPWKVQVQFLYYKGIFLFFDQKYDEAANCFDAAFDAARSLTSEQLHRLLTYSIPASYLAKNRVPTRETWSQVPKLASLYEPLITACRHGDYPTFNKLLSERADKLRQTRIYLACDQMIPRLRLNLLRRTWAILDKPKRIPVQAFAEALKTAQLGLANMDYIYAAEFYVSQFILKGEVKGYIHHELKLIMVSKTAPFPTLVKG